MRRRSGQNDAAQDCHPKNPHEGQFGRSGVLVAN